MILLNVIIDINNFGTTTNLADNAEFFFTQVLPGHIKNYGGLVGNANHTSHLLVFFLYTSWVTFILSSTKKFYWFLIPISSVITIYMLWLTESRGAFMGLGIGAVIALIYYLLKNWRWKFLLLLSVFVGSFVLVFWVSSLTPYYAGSSHNVEIWQYSIGDFKTDSSVTTRAALTTISNRAFLDKPLTGYGPNLFTYAYYKNNRPSIPYMLPGGFFQEIDKPHNIYSDFISMNGILGALFFSLLIIYLLYIASKTNNVAGANRRTTRNKIHALSAGYLSFFLIHGLAVSFQFIVSVTFFIALTFILFLHKNGSAKTGGEIKFSAKVTRVLCLVVIVVTMLLTWHGAIMPYRQSQSYVRWIDEISKAEELTPKQITNSFENIRNISNTVGQQELVTFYLEDIKSLIAKNTDDQATANALAEHARKQIEPDYVRHLFSINLIYVLIWEKFDDEAARQTIKKIAHEMCDIAPKFPLSHDFLDYINTENNCQ